MKLDTSPQALAKELLGREYNDLGHDEQQILCRISSGEIKLDPDELESNHAGFGERLADSVARVGGSWGFIIVFAIIIMVWMTLNSPVAKSLGLVWDTYPFIFLNLLLSTIAAFQAPVIMMSQNRQARKDRISSRHDYEVNLRTTVELLRLHRKVDKLFNKLGHMEDTVDHVGKDTAAAVAHAIEITPGGVPGSGGAGGGGDL